eukprot:CAMPEP_0184678668 /NCGR_PEP_ID=MMETSP0312-20130426/1451_1 /TAXON_ID=31354 /ORGANISM="Compsopogon coeruleus, Strain SAG 36.94" /LENGTH=1048 /DNA_ID=CAMNT_0027127583 /DNA_START=383 /DNA_END=3529 /DNA_ORIENTATION=-
MLQILFLAFPGVALQAGLIALFQQYVTRAPGFGWYESLMFGSMLSATDPIAVTATLRAIGASENLGTIIEGESLLNDGSAFVLWEAFYANVLEPGSLSAGEIFVEVLRLSLGGIAMGLFFGLVAAFFLAIVYEVFEVETSLTVIIALLGFWVAQAPAKVSGVICNVVSGLVLSALGKPLISPKVREPLSHFWELVAFIANTIVFVYAGMLVVAFAWTCSDKPLVAKDYYFIPVWFIWLQVIRFASVYLSYPILRWRQPWFNIRHATVVGFSGLRGAISLILALEVGNSDRVSNSVSARVVVWTCAIVALSLLFNGTFIKTLLHILRLDIVGSAKKEFLLSAKGLMLQRTFTFLDSIAFDNSFKLASWSTVVKFVIPESWLGETFGAAQAYARMSMDMPRWSWSSRASSVAEFGGGLTRRSLDLEELELQRMNYGAGNDFLVGSETPFQLRDSTESAAAPNITPQPRATRNPSGLTLTVPMRSSSFVRVSEARESVNEDVESSSSPRPSVVYNSFNRYIESRRRVTYGVGEDIDVEVRRRFLGSLLRHTRAAYETSIVEFGALQGIEDDIKTAIDFNDDGIEYEIFSFLRRPPLLAKLGKFGRLASRKLIRETRLSSLNHLAVAVTESLKDPALARSSLVLQEAETLYQAIVSQLDRLEAIDPTTYSFVQTDAAVRLVYETQEKVLEELLASGTVDQSDFKILHGELLDLRRSYIPRLLRRRSIFLPTSHEVISNSPLFEQVPADAIAKLGDDSDSRVRRIRSRQKVDGAWGVGLVLSGCLEIMDDQDSMHPREESVGAVVQSSALSQTRASFGDSGVSMHWSLSMYSVLLNPDAFTLSGRGCASGAAPFCVQGCHVVGGASVLLVNMGKTTQLARENRGFRLELARAYARMVALRTLKHPKPYALDEFTDNPESGAMPDDGPMSRAILILRRLPYTELIQVARNSRVYVEGPATLLFGRIEVEHKGTIEEYVAPATLPSAALTVTTKEDDAPETGGFAELLIVPPGSVEEVAMERSRNWISSTKDSNGRFGAHKHIDLVLESEMESTS